MKPKSQIKKTDYSSAVDAFLKTFNEVLAVVINTSCPKLSHKKKKTRTIKPDVS